MLVTEQHRLECEARYMLAHANHEPADIRRLLQRLKRKRPAANVARLAAEMRRQFAQHSTHSEGSING